MRDRAVIRSHVRHFTSGYKKISIRSPLFLNS